MYFHIPTRIFIGQDILAQHGDEIAKYGKNALIVTGRTSAVKSGVLDDLLPILEKNDINYTIFNEITENPETSAIKKACDLFSPPSVNGGRGGVKPDFIIAIGGGSPIDAGKAISLSLANDIDIHTLHTQQPEKTQHAVSLLGSLDRALPIIAIPTTSGTGSECTQYSVLNNSQTGIKAGFGSELMFPKVALLDPKYTLTLNSTITRDTAIDALSHLLEGLYSNKHNPYLMPIILEGIKLIYTHLSPCLADLSNLTHRTALMLASNYGGVVIAHTSTTLQHSIGYPLTTEFSVSHGLANGLVMKQMMDLYEPHLKGRLKLVFDYLNITKAIFYDWLDSLEMSFAGKIDDDFINSRVTEVLRSRNMALNPTDISAEQIADIYKSL